MADENMINSSIEQRVSLWQQFFERKNSRKLLGFFYGSEFPVRRYSAAHSLPEGRDLYPEDFTVEEYLEDNDRLFSEMEEFPGDFIFSASAFWGIPWLEAAAGCPVRVNHSTGSVYALKPPYGDKPAVPEFCLGSPWIRKLTEFLTSAAVRSNGRYPLATTRMRGVADLLAALYGAEELIFRMMTDPEEVHSVASKLTDFYIEFGKHQLELIPPFRGGIGSFYYHLLAPSGTVWHQEDSSMLLSPELFSSFILPCTSRVFQAFAGNIMHFHSTGGFIPLEEILSLKPLAVEMHIDSGGPGARELYGKHKMILENTALIIWGKLSEDDFRWIFGKLDSNAVAVNAVVDDAETARQLYCRYAGGEIAY